MLPLPTGIGEGIAEREIRGNGRGENASCTVLPVLCPCHREGVRVVRGDQPIGGQRPVVMTAFPENIEVQSTGKRL